jgi:K(+)-stimulated pyrophosphate-energized sodium pump
MNMVSLLTLGVVLKYNIISGREEGGWKIGLVAALVCVVAIAWAVWQSKRETEDMQS